MKATARTVRLSARYVATTTRLTFQNTSSRSSRSSVRTGAAAGRAQSRPTRRLTPSGACNRAAVRPADTVSADDGEPRPLFELPRPRRRTPDAVERTEERERAWMAVGRLPEPEASEPAGVLRTEVPGGRILVIPVGTVKSRLHAALTKLTEEWDDGGASDEGREPEQELEGGAQGIENLLPVRFAALRSGVRKP